MSRRNQRLSHIFTVVCLALAAAPARATTVIPLSFDEIVTQAGAIALVETVRVRSDWKTSPRGKHIVTHVTFRVDRVIKGQAGPTFELELLGGNIGGLVMDVEGMPQFRVGDRDGLFLSSIPNSASPIVGLFQGRFRLEGDRGAGTERVLTHNGKPFVAASAGARRFVLSNPAAPARALSYPEFESLVAQTLAQSR